MSYFGIRWRMFLLMDYDEIYFFYSNSHNPADCLPNSRDGRNHLLVISSVFGLLSARAGVHRRHQLKISRKGQRSLGAADGDNFILDRLANHFDHALWMAAGIVAALPGPPDPYPPSFLILPAVDAPGKTPTLLLSHRYPGWSVR